MVKFQGLPTSLSGNFPLVGEKAPEFSLCSHDLKELSSNSLIGKKIVLNIFPSVETEVCAMSVLTFREKLKDLNAELFNVSADLPFASQRFGSSNGIDSSCFLSFYRSLFAHDYGVYISEGPLKGLSARATVVIDEKGTVIHSELVSEITSEPNYEAVVLALIN